MKRPYRPKINWTPDMIQKLKIEFPIRFNKELAAEFGCSWRSLVRKARELNIEKEPDFLDKNRNTITAMAVKNKPLNQYFGVKGWSVPGGEKYRYKKGNIPATKTNPELVKQIHEKRNKTITAERRRIMFGLKQKTNLNLL